MYEVSTKLLGNAPRYILLCIVQCAVYNVQCAFSAMCIMWEITWSLLQIKYLDCTSNVNLMKVDVDSRYAVPYTTGRQYPAQQTLPCKTDRQYPAQQTDTTLHNRQTVPCTTDRHYPAQQTDNTLHNRQILPCTTDSTLHNRLTLPCTTDTTLHNRQYPTQQTDTTLHNRQYPAQQTAVSCTTYSTRSV